MAAAPRLIMARNKKFSSEVWDEKNKLMLLLSTVSKDDDKALCKSCNTVLTAGSKRSGTSHLKRHPDSMDCKRKAAARRAAGDDLLGLGGWAVDGAVTVLQATSPEVVQAVQWRQGTDTMLLLRERPHNMAELQQQGFQVLLLPEVEQRVQAETQDLQGLLVQQQPAAVPSAPTSATISGLGVRSPNNGSDDDLTAAVRPFVPHFNNPAGN